VKNYLITQAPNMNPKFKLHRNSSALLSGVTLLGILALPFSAVALTTSEGFENGSKTSYTAATVSLGSGSWYLDSSLIGTTTSDAKTGSRSVRLQGSGFAEMQFNKTGGAGTVTIKHAKFGADANTSWALFCSNNNGTSWNQIGSTVNTASTSLTTATFSANLTGNVRCSIDKQDGTSARLNIDDVNISDYTPTPTPTPTPAPSPTPTSTSSSIHLLMGNPSGATANTSNPNNFLLTKPQYALSYNNSRKTPNWVSWQLNSSWIGSAPRQDDFRPDPSLPAGFYQVTSTDYSGSGFDRGHMTPSADRTSTVANNSATFFMTNMVPQAPDNNQGPWARLEDYERQLVSQGKELYVVSGVYGDCGTGSQGRKCTLTTSSGQTINVPSRTWKAILVLDNPGSGLSGVNANTRVIAVDMPNDQGIRSIFWGNYRVTVRDIENRTGINLFSNIPVSIQNVIETRVDNQ
jgi:endonuclease G, mitochondrial